MENLYTLLTEIVPKEQLDDIEHLRKEQLEDILQDMDYGEIQDRYIKSKEHKHAILHLSSVMTHLFETEILSDPYIVSNPHLYQIAMVAFNHLFGLYQEIGAETVTKDETDA